MKEKLIATFKEKFGDGGDIIHILHRVVLIL